MKALNLALRITIHNEILQNDQHFVNNLTNYPILLSTRCILLQESLLLEMVKIQVPCLHIQDSLSIYRSDLKRQKAWIHPLSVSSCTHTDCWGHTASGVCSCVGWNKWQHIDSDWFHEFSWIGLNQIIRYHDKQYTIWSRIKFVTFRTQILV